MKLFRRRAAARSAELCEACSQVCTSQCRAEAHLERARAWTAYQTPFPR